VERTKKVAIILQLTTRMANKGIWCAEANIQKGIYSLQETLGVYMDFDFVVYKKQNISFELQDELTAMRADNLLVLKEQNSYPYALLPGIEADLFLKKFFDKKYGTSIDYIVEELASNIPCKN